jgi:UDP-N-acetylmuramyl pentapeptide synthase
MMRDHTKWTLAESAAQVGGRLAGTDTADEGVVLDSPGDCRGQQFAVLRGERRDGHDTVAKAAGHSGDTSLIDGPPQPALGSVADVCNAEHR